MVRSFLSRSRPALLEIFAEIIRRQQRQSYPCRVERLSWLTMTSIFFFGVGFQILLTYAEFYNIRTRKKPRNYARIA